MPDQDEEEFDHQVTAWTVSQLRDALAGVSGDLPVTVQAAEEPGGEFASEQVIVGAGPWAVVDVGTGPATHSLPRIPGGTADDVRAKLTSGELQADHFEITLEFPAGRYYRRTR